MLRRAGFEDGLLAAIQDSPELEDSRLLPTSHGLAEVSHWLKKGSMESSTDLLLIEVAFIGSPGTGKTTSLCKILAHSSFFENYEAHVFKLDQIPNPDDALRIFFANPLVSTSTDRSVLATLPPNELLYVDTPVFH